MLRLGRVEEKEPLLEGAAEPSPGVIASSERRMEDDEPLLDSVSAGELVLDMRRLPNGSEMDRSRGEMAGVG